MKTRLLNLTPKEFCRKTKACPEGARFAARYKTMSRVWEKCPRVDWLIWILDAIGAERDERAERLFAVWCAKNTPLSDGMTTGDLLTDPSSLAALEVAERFANGLATRAELAAASWAAWSAAWSAARRAAWWAAWSAARSAALRAAWWAAQSAAAWSAAESAWSAARSAQANEFRRVIKNPFAP